MEVSSHFECGLCTTFPSITLCKILGWMCFYCNFIPHQRPFYPIEARTRSYLERLQLSYTCEYQVRCVILKLNLNQVTSLLKDLVYIFIGYSYGKKGWHIYDLQSEEIFIMCDAILYGDIFTFSSDIQMMNSANQDHRFHLYEGNLHRGQIIHDTLLFQAVVNSRLSIEGDIGSE